jgi:DNA-binding MarR family transcriptional regulator
MNEMDTAAHIIEVVPYLARTIAADARQMLGEGWFTLVHLRVLAFVRMRESCSLGDLAQRRGVSLPTMSKMVTSLVEKGLVTREPDPDNRRAVIIRLTEEGNRLYVAVLASVQQSVAHDMARLTPEQRGEVVSALELLATAMSNPDEARQHLHLPIAP